LAWGPHPEITIAAYSALEPQDPFRAFIENDTKTLASICWMCDRAFGVDGPQSSPGITEVRNLKFFARDVMFMPGFAPGVYPPVHGYGGRTNEAYEPEFNRLIQAMRTESKPNMLGWLGTIIHISEDTGAPPHAEPTLSPHGLTENMAHPEAIQIKGYVPRLLGPTPAAALAGYEQRMWGLHDFSVQRAEKMKPLAKAGDRAALEPYMLECANEAARCLADVLHTVGYLEQQMKPVAGTGGLAGTIGLQTGAAAPTVVPRIALLGTHYSTLAEPNGRYQWRNLPPGNYEVAVLCPGYAPTRATARVAAGQETQLAIPLRPSNPPGNLLRNGDFSVRFLNPDRPDGWYKFINPKTKIAEWRSESFTVKRGQSMRITAVWKGGGSAQIVAKWKGKTTSQEEPPMPAGTAKVVYAAPAKLEGYQDTGWLVIRGTDDPVQALHSIAVTIEGK
jgi:hypothetical protein